MGRDVDVEAMMSDTGHVFYGDLRSHERAGFFSELLLEVLKSVTDRWN